MSFDTLVYSNKPLKRLSDEKVAKAYEKYKSEIKHPTNEENFFINTALQLLGEKPQIEHYDTFDIHTIAPTTKKEIKLTPSDKRIKEFISTCYLGKFDSMKEFKTYCDRYDIQFCTRNKITGFIPTNTRWEPNMFVLLYTKLETGGFDLYKFPFQSLLSATQEFSTFTYKLDKQYVNII